jgi:hypothetical protein
MQNLCVTDAMTSFVKAVCGKAIRALTQGLKREGIGGGGLWGRGRIRRRRRRERDLLVLEGRGRVQWGGFESVRMGRQVCGGFAFVYYVPDGPHELPIAL